MKRRQVAYLQREGAISDLEWKVCPVCEVAMPEPRAKHSMHSLDCLNYHPRQPPMQRKFA